LNFFRQNKKLKSGGWAAQKKVEELKPMPPLVPPLWAYATPGFTGHSFHVISGEMWYYLPIHRCSFLFQFNLKYIFVSLCMYNSRINLLTIISCIKIWC